MPVESADHQAKEGYQLSKSPAATRLRRFYFIKNRNNGPIKQQGQKRRFGIAGALNVLITNGVLQALLASNQVTITMATLTSQIINTTLGYLIYGRVVFKTKGLGRHRPIIRYLILMSAMWGLNTVGIKIGIALTIKKSIMAAAIIPFLAVPSFLVQKYWVFKK
ncbi:GtrA family protein [Cyanobium sp. HWJ4-Hawea]|uniref:GtrA family protein n=1 Tax=Cyanobium sp. HWJ4-Hawea TaxID=2823713 RepID=UPI0020CBD773|nr:GtrA family protein [Cyanobium sp. HWJ4-Hawea]MCP9808590.1 GtrA family protein [Cyanobium sp. HWJ4-Hawea]